jgi:hypothetical protein
MPPKLPKLCVPFVKTERSYIRRPVGVYDPVESLQRTAPADRLRDECDNVDLVAAYARSRSVAHRRTAAFCSNLPADDPNPEPAARVNTPPPRTAQELLAALASENTCEKAEAAQDKHLPAHAMWELWQ